MEIMLTGTRSSHLLLIASLFSQASFADKQPEPAQEWECRGYCYYGGDAPTSPLVPVAARGATEEEARNNIDCDGFEEVDITCALVSDDDDSKPRFYRPKN